MTDEAPVIPERDHDQLSVSLRCPDCKRWSERVFGAALGDTLLVGGVPCGGCGRALPCALDEHTERHESTGRRPVLDGCPACGYHTLCIQKDVNARLGVIVIVVTFGVLLFSGLSVPWLLAALIPLALVDLFLLRRFVKRLLICYRCKSQYRGFLPGPRCRPFDLATWEAFDELPGDESTGDRA